MVDTIGFVPLPQRADSEDLNSANVLIVNSFAPRAILEFGDVSLKSGADFIHFILNPMRLLIINFHIFSELKQSSRANTSEAVSTRRGALQKRLIMNLFVDFLTESLQK